eukprot:s2134_g7.t1
MFIATEPVPMWPAFPPATAKGQELMGQPDPSWHQWLAPLDNVWIPSYIAYGLVDTVAPLYGVMAPKGKGSSFEPSAQKGTQKGGKAKSATAPLAPDEQEFHQEMLRKLALHLAAQPDAMPGPGPAPPGPVEPQQDESPERVSHFCECANFFLPVERPDATPRDSPRSFCATPEEHGMPVWTDRHATATPGANGAPGGLDDEQSNQGHCVCVPSYIVHGLLEAWEGKARRSKAGEQNFHHEMLKKLALHLAAQPGEPTAQMPQMPQVQQVYMPVAPQPGPPVQPVPVFAPHAPPVQRSPAAPRMGLFHDHRPQEEFHRQMLQKLALHLAAQPDSPTGHGEAKSSAHSHPDQAQAADLAAPVQLEIEPRINQAAKAAEQVGEDKAHCDSLMEDLEVAERRSEVVSWVLSSNVLSLSLTQFGSRVVQKAIASASDVRDREKFAEELLQHAMDLYVSPHGNHVLAKLIEVLPSTRLVCIAEKMRGQATVVARHQFGSRILERLMEHCSEEQMGFLLDELFDGAANLEALARHPFANFVVQHIFEHGMPERKSRCFQMLLPYVLQHATHKTASNVVQRMLEHADVSSQALIADAFLAGEGEESLETIAATRYGSFVVHSLVDKLHPRIDAVKARVKAAQPQLSESKFSQKNILDFLGEAFFDD